jgi:uncharacterized membrane protein
MAWLDQALNFFGYAVCHGLPSRSITVGGYFLPVCSRCTGIYLGIAVTYVFLIVRRGFKVNALPSLGVSLAVAAMLLPMAVDGVSSYAGLRGTTNTMRFLTGLAAGAALPIFAFPLLSPELIVDGRKKKVVRPFGRAWDYAIWLGALAAAGALVFVPWAGLYYPLTILVVAGLVGIFFNLSLVVWEMVLERAGRWGRRPQTLAVAALTVLLVFSALNVFHYVAFRAMAEVANGAPPG